ncbi:MAG: putative nucleotidyltransferase substrate binding domain-containing protein [Humidesulfovibrio sp.]|uniref:putative nucleotidyltransferase substrate binding domain-containing protein n=1 Tax=Humidesulfovibrio sp. TaxID=2910988 RepID=UPI0027353613|nr:putative nucleotidyltransferase substrate binding domain-containing protein [Humidesulfovibrio sp.]MDP2847212.1 putative nucleotidyltransferase substrate binding domain-containing protein [Humidesulfovibrio sp.]
MHEPDASGAPHLPDPFLRLKASDVPTAAPVFVNAGATVAEAARAMAMAGATAALVRPELKHHTADLGILTERDVLVRVVAAGLDAANLPVTRIMSHPLITVRPGDLLIEAFSRMVRHGVRRLVLLDESGAPVGLLGEGDMLAARGESPLALAAEINAASSEAALARAFQRLQRLAARSVAEGIGSSAVGRLISEMHDRIMSQAWGLALAQATAEHGPAPASHAVFLLGSQARREQYLATDQDLALVFAGGDPKSEAWFAALGEGLTRILLNLGFPPCPRRIMLDNPNWRRSLDSWMDLADNIADRPDAEGVVTASLLSDLRPLPAPPGQGGQSGSAADPDLAHGLGLGMAARFRGSALLLKCMAREAVRFAPPLGLFGGFSLKKDAEGRGSVDLKRGGVFPITQGAKVLALEHGLHETGTQERLQALARAGTLDRQQAEGLCEANAFLQTLRMRAQAEAIGRGETPDNAIRPEELGKLDGERLRGAFKLVADFQGMLSGAYALHLMG